MVAYPECFAWRASLHAGHLAVSTRRGCVTAERTVWTGQMKNAVVCINNLSISGSTEERHHFTNTVNVGIDDIGTLLKIYSFMMDLTHMQNMM